MPVVINTPKKEKWGLEPLPVLSDVLPCGLYREIIKKLTEAGRIEEIRCRRDRRTYLTCSHGNFGLDFITSANDLSVMMDKLCGGSLYAHKETILDGYITLDGGIRVGVCGRATVENGKIIGVYDVSSLNFRIPTAVTGIGEPVCGLLREGGGGVLIFSPPGVGKTTLLRSVARKMSVGTGSLRVCVIDTRGELSAVGGTLGDSVDILLGYPRGKGIEIATRVMNAELIVCDEIGDAREAEAILGAQNCGVPLLASAHGEALSALLLREGIRRLHEGRVFSHYVGIRRRDGELFYDITEREAADGYL